MTKFQPGLVQKEDAVANSDGCRNRLRRYNSQSRPYPSLQRSCALRRMPRCSQMLGSKRLGRAKRQQIATTYLAS